MRSPIDALVTEKALRIVNKYDTGEFVTEHAEELGLKNVCARVHPQLAEEIDQLCGLLSVSKRCFLEAAFIEAVQKAWTILEAEGVQEALREDQGEGA